MNVLYNTKINIIRFGTLMTISNDGTANQMVSFLIFPTGVDECEWTPCLFNGICTDEEDGYSCECVDERLGRNCLSPGKLIE